MTKKELRRIIEEQQFEIDVLRAMLQDEMRKVNIYDILGRGSSGSTKAIPSVQKPTQSPYEPYDTGGKMV
jgi:hypothetical protein